MYRQPMPDITWVMNAIANASPGTIADQFAEISARTVSAQADRAALVARLVARGWTQAEIARAAKVSQAAISKAYGGTWGNQMSFIAERALDIWRPATDGSLADHVRYVIGQVGEVNGAPCIVDEDDPAEVAATVAFAEELLAIDCGDDY